MIIYTITAYGASKLVASIVKKVLNLQELNVLLEQPPNLKPEIQNSSLATECGEFSDGTSVTKYYINGQLFSEHWKKNGLFHRDDGPACIIQNRHFSWYRNGLLHRENGPASYVITKNGDIEVLSWCQHGRHRQDWWNFQNNTSYTYEEYKKQAGFI